MSWQRSMAALCVTFLLAGCRQSKEAPAAGESAAPVLPARPLPAPEAMRVAPLEVCQPGGRDPLEAARGYFDAGRFAEALSCAALWAADYPDAPEGHAERGGALAALGRLEEAQLAYARALALDPDHLDSLWGAARLYAVEMPSTRDRDELGAAYAERGLALAERRQDRRMISDFALLSAMAFNDLGRSREALARTDRVRALEPKNPEVGFERAVALFELCRFSEAKAAFQSLLEDPQRSAHAHYHLGLLLEREGKQREAERHFTRAREGAPGEFFAPELLPEEEFRAEVARAVAELPEDMRRDLGSVPVSTEDIPVEEDLLSGDPPLSPTILGLFRGPPLGEACAPEEAPCRSVVLYRRNLARAVSSREELLEQIRVTLLHEVGHLRGEDDLELAARGLE